MTTPSKKYLLLKSCRRCGADVHPSEKATHQAFCSALCRERWWSDRKSRRMSRGEINDLIVGSPLEAREWTEIQSAWLAGIVDGEGTIGIWRYRRSGNRSGWAFRPVVEIFNTNRLLIDRILEIVGPAWSAIKEQPKVPRHKVCWKVAIRTRAIPATLLRIHPYLVAKAEQAQLVVAFCETRLASPARTEGDYPLYEDFWLKCKELNRRGLSV